MFKEFTLFPEAFNDLIGNLQSHRALKKIYYRGSIIVYGIGKRIKLVKDGIISIYFGIIKIDLFFYTFGILQDHGKIIWIFGGIFHLPHFALAFKKVYRNISVPLKKSSFPHIFQ